MQAYPLTSAPIFVATCKICDSGAYNFDVVDFNKLCSLTDFYQFGLSGEPVYYLCCSNCGFIFTRYCDQWTTTDFSERIYNSEYILVDGEYAGARTKKMVEQFLHFFPSASNLSLLDYGSGNGGFSEQLSERGFSSTTSYDPYSSPTRPEGRFDVITAIEVVEHSPDPIGTFKDLLSLANDNSIIIFTTMAQPDDISSVRGNNWYMAPRNGHISFFSHHSLCEIARQCGLQYFDDKGFKIMTRGTPPIVPRSLPLQTITLGSPLAQPAEGWHSIERPRACRRDGRAIEKLRGPCRRARPSRWTLPFPTPMKSGPILRRSAISRWEKMWCRSPYSNPSWATR